MNFIDTLLTQSKQSFSKSSNSNKSLPYVENIQRDLPLIVAKVVPATQFGLYNLRMCADLVRNVSLQLLILGYDEGIDVIGDLDSDNTGKENKNSNDETNGTSGTKEHNTNKTNNNGNSVILDKNEEAALKVAKFEQEFKKTNLLEDQLKLDIERRVKNKKQKKSVLASAETDANNDHSGAEFQPIEIDKVGTGVPGAWKILVDRKKMSQYITYKSHVVEDKINGNGNINTNGDINDDDNEKTRENEEGETEDTDELKHEKGSGNGKTAASTATATSAFASASVPTGNNLELSREQILARMEADRERVCTFVNFDLNCFFFFFLFIIIITNHVWHDLLTHKQHKKAKESLWMIERQTTEKVDKAEFQKLWDRCGPLTNDDLRELSELSEVALKSYNF